MSLGIHSGGTSKCGGHTNCQCCDVISARPKSSITVNGQKVYLPSGNCKSKNIIYLSECKLCVNKFYVGRTVQPLHKRLTGHRQGLKTVVSNGLNYLNAPELKVKTILLFMCLNM